MAELSGFRRFSYQAERRQSNVPRKSIISVATSIQPTGQSWLYIVRAMNKQTISLWTGFILCAVATTINNYFYYVDLYNKMFDEGNKFNVPIEIFAVTSYYLGACIGSCTCGMNPYTWPAKRTNYVIGFILIIACGFLFGMDSLPCFCIARLSAGFSYGFVYIALMTHIADNVMKSVRGYIAVDFGIWNALGFMLAVGFSANTWESMPFIRWTFNGILFAIPIASIILTNYLTYEPITWLLKMDLEIEARKALEESRNNLIDPLINQHEIDEKKLMLIEDYDDQSQHCGFQRVLQKRNALMLVLILLLRIVNIFTTNIYFNMLSAISINRESALIMLLILIGVRTVVLLIPKYSIDKLGRKVLLLTSGLGSGILFIPFAAQHMNYINMRRDLLGIITFSIHIISALGIDPAQHIYACEVFPLNKRNASLAIVTCVEYILHGFITMCVLLDETLILQIILLTTPFAILLFTIILFVKLPETKSMALRRCRDRHNKKPIRKTLQPRVSGIQTLGSTYM